MFNNKDNNKNHLDLYQCSLIKVKQIVLNNFYITDKLMNAPEYSFQRLCTLYLHQAFSIGLVSTL